MKAGVVAGALLILVGIIMLSVGGFSFTSQERVVDLGPLEVSAARERSVAVPPLLAGLAIAAGVVLIVASPRRAR